MQRLASSICVLLIFVAAAPLCRAQTETPLPEHYVDSEYGYSFRYPAGWKLVTLPEGEANKDVRAILQGPGGSSFTVVVERSGKNVSRGDFERDSDRSGRTEKLIQQVMAQVYEAISANLRAEKMKVGERRDLSNETAIKFYISTLHLLKAGKPIIVAGIHAYPFAKEFSINFIMSAFWDKSAGGENEVLKTVFNSFHLTGEPPAPPVPAAGAETGSPK